MIILIVLSVLHFLSSLLGGFLICRPVSKTWKPAVKGQCGNEFVAHMSFETIGLALDKTIILWPLYDIMNLKLPFGKKSWYFYHLCFWNTVGHNNPHQTPANHLSVY